MDQELYGPFNSLETTLTSLIESITAYNPSVNAIDSLATANDELNQALLRLQTHQQNHQTLQTLHLRSADLTTQIKETLSTLSSLRKDLLDLSLSTIPDDSSSPVGGTGQEATRRLDPTQLLAFATHIARTSVPPSAAIREVKAQTGAEEELAAAKPTANGNGEVVAGLSAEEREEMERSRKEREGKWVPWPDEGVIRAGVLAGLENGGGVMAGDEGGQAKEGEEEVKMEVENGLREHRGVRVVEEKPAVFTGLDLDDD